VSVQKANQDLLGLELEKKDSSSCVAKKLMVLKRGSFTAIPGAAMLLLPSTAYKVNAVIWAFTMKTGEPWNGLKGLASICNITDDVCKGAIKLLCEKGFLVRKEGTNTYSPWDYMPIVPYETKKVRWSARVSQAEVAPLYKLWGSKCGVVHKGTFYKAVTPVIKAIGAEKAMESLTEYISQTETKFASASNWASKYKQYVKEESGSDISLGREEWSGE